MSPLSGPFRRSLPSHMAIGPLGRIIAQIIVPAIAIMAKTLPAAYAAALENARKSGTANEGSNAGDASRNMGASFLGKARMSKDEALMVLNLTESDATVEAVNRQYERYFESNKVENGGSFYLQSKIYRAKELLDEYVKEKEAGEGKQEQPGSGGGGKRG
jgi:import inner membrane translocase subunit TIM16